MATNKRSFISDLVTTSTVGGPLLGNLINSLQAYDMVPREYSIAFSVLPPPPPNQAVATKATINWKVDGQQRSRIITVTNGAIISGVCEAVDVTLQDYSGTLGINQPAGRAYKVAASLSPGLRATIQQPPFLVPLPAQLIGAGGHADFPVDQNAGVLSVYVMAIGGTADPAQGITALQFSPGFVSQAQFFPLEPGEWAPLFPGTETIRVQNNNADTINATVFLGIEG